MKRVAGLVALAMLASPGGATSLSGPSELHVVNLAQGAGPLAVRVCRHGGGCGEYDLAGGHMLRFGRLSAGRYDFIIASTGKRVERFTYGVGHGQFYSLALYGVVEAPARFGWAAWLKRWLGGSEERQVSGYVFHHRMLSLRPPRAEEPGRVKFANYAPGAAGLGAHVEWETGGQTVGPVKWDSASDWVDVPRSSALFAAMLGTGRTPAAKSRIGTPRGSATIVYAAALEGSGLSLVVDRAAR